LLCLLCSCANGKAQAREEAFRAYYQGLKTEGADAYAHFETALKSSNPSIVRAASAELVLPILRGDLDTAALLNPKNSAAGPSPLPAAALYAQGRYGELLGLYEELPPGPENPDPWDRLLPLLARLCLAQNSGEADASPAQDGREIGGPPVREALGAAGEALLTFLFDTAPGPALSWAAEEIRRRAPDFLSAPENSALEGRLAAARSAFGQGLSLFRPALEEEPALFLQYPALITDLGRCFQFGSADDEGLDLFLAWAAASRTGVGAAASPPGGASPRYGLLYYAGRIARARGDYRRSGEIFTQALALAPDEEQQDACVWYIMDTALRDEAPDPLGLVKTWMPRWHDASYFSDILDRIARELAAGGQWRRFPEALALVEQGGDRISLAKYAYISGRALMEGLISPEEAGGAEAAHFFRMAYDTGEGALYYRALSAFFLGEPFLTLGTARPKAEDFPHREEMDFLLGFFTQAIPGPALGHLEELDVELSTGELRALAEAMTKAGAYAQAIRLSSSYMARKDYDLLRQDLELLSPRPFQELIEAQAREAGLAPELFYGLIRTESAFQPEVFSRVGAAGLAQLMPATAADMADRMRRRGGPDYTGNLDLQDPEINVRIGAYYLNYLGELLEHPLLALLAYNGGLSRVRRWYRAQTRGPFSLPLPGDLFLETIEYPETREYGRKVISSAAVYGYLYYGVNPPPFLADICR
jgi:soluble lytic murein transglycosylase